MSQSQRPEERHTSKKDWSVCIAWAPVAVYGPIRHYSAVGGLGGWGGDGGEWGRVRPVRAWIWRDHNVPPNRAQQIYTLVCGCVSEWRCVSESVCIWGHSILGVCQKELQQ